MNLLEMREAILKKMEDIEFRKGRKKKRSFWTWFIGK